MTTTLFLIRHGATEQNDSRPVILQGCGIDGPLSSAGRQQAARVAGVLSRFPLSRVFASPLLRAQQTAAAIAGPHALTVETVPALCEVDVGEWEGRSWDWIMAEDAEWYDRFLADSAEVPYHGGESYRDVLQRAKPALASLLSECSGETIAVVAHNVVNRALIADLLSIPLQSAKDIRQSNCCVNVIRGRAGAYELVTLNAGLELLCSGTVSPHEAGA